MGCAGALQPSFEQRGLFDFLFDGVAVPERVGVGAEDVDSGLFLTDCSEGG